MPYWIDNLINRCLVIVEEFNYLEQTNAPSSLHSYLSAILAVALTALLAFWYTRWLERKKATHAVLAEFSADLSVIEELCRSYWLGSHQEGAEQEKAEAISYVLIAKLTNTNTYRVLLKELLGDDFEQYEELDANLFIHATGGDFQTRKMVACPATYLQISDVLTKMENLLRKARSNV